MAATTTTTATTTTIVAALIFSLLVLSPICNACCGCTTPPPTPKMPPPAPSTPPPSKAHCPKDALKLGVCADVLGLVHVVLGAPPSGTKCCALLMGLADLDAAVCLCTAIKANVLGINLDVPLTLSVLLSACQKSLPDGFKC